MISRIRKTRAIVLRWVPVSETSRAVTWLTEDHGRLTTLVKGSQRPKSAFLGQYDLFQTCELLYYARPDDQLLIAKECSPLVRRDALREDWRACGAASYLAGLIGRVAPVNAPSPELFRLLGEMLDDLVVEGASQPHLFWAELKLLGAIGLTPRLGSCVQCGALLKSGLAAGFDAARGGILCARCRPGAREPASEIAPDTLALLAAWQASTPRLARATRCTARQLAALDRVLGAFLAHHLDVPPTGRREVLDLLARRLPAGAHSPLHTGERR